MKVTYLFYTSSYNGTLPQPLFDAGVQRASEVILALLYPRCPGDLTEEERTAVHMAVCAQIDAGLDRPVLSESTGSGSVRYHDGLLRIHGMPVAAGALGYLERAGLACRWV